MLYNTTTTCRSESNRENLHQTQRGPKSLLSIPRTDVVPGFRGRGAKGAEMSLLCHLSPEFGTVRGSFCACLWRL